MDANQSPKKLFYGLFVFPLLIAVAMAVLLCTVVFLTHEEQSPETLITAIKTGSPSKRWQKAFELSNELNSNKQAIRQASLMNEIIHVLRDSDRYDAPTRSYMAIALNHFDNPQAVEALTETLNDHENGVVIYALWSLGVMRAKSAVSAILPILKSEDAQLRKTAAYVLGAIGDPAAEKSVLPLLDDSVADVRWNAALSLARLGNGSGRNVLMSMLDRNVLKTNFELQESEIEQVMINAVKGLALIGNPDSVVLQKISREDKSLKVRQAALDALQYNRNMLQKSAS